LQVNFNNNSTRAIQTSSIFVTCGQALVG